MLKVKIIDEAHEKDLEKSINSFLISGEYDIINIQFSTAVTMFSDEQIYCFSVLILYEEK